MELSIRHSTFKYYLGCSAKYVSIFLLYSVLREGLQELYDFILDEVTRTGFLTKKGHNMIKTQKSRWYALKPDKLTYYVSSGFREKKGDIVLNGDAKVTSIPDKGSNKCRFSVTCGSTKKDYEQTAPDQRTKQAWMTDIQTAIGRIILYICYLAFISLLQLVNKMQQTQLSIS